jgi:phenylalanyl-tRNA synthetase beta chain
MVPNLLDGMLKAVSWNINRKNKDLMIFETGNVYTRASKGKGFDEIPALCVGMTGLARDNWMEKKRNADFYDVKGAIEEAMHILKVGIGFVPVNIEGIAPSCGVEINGEKGMIGFIGGVSKTMLAKYDIEQEVFIAQLRLDGVFREAVLSRRYHSLPRFPFSTRDISILCDDPVSSGDILGVIKETGEELIKDVQLADVYKGENIPQGKKSLTYSIKYGLDTRTLREEEIEAIHARVKDALVKKFNVSFR